VRPDDAEPLLRMQHAQQCAVLGRPDATLEDIRSQLADPDLDPRSSVAVDDDDRVVGCSLVTAAGDEAHADLEVVVDPGAESGLFAALLAQALDVAVAGAHARGHAHVQIDAGCYRDDVASADALRREGFRQATSFHRMRRELAAPVEVVVPQGVVVERVDDESDEALRRAHRLHTATFAGHFAFVARPYDEWLAAHRARSGTGPLWFATRDAEDVGFLHENDMFVPDENAGYVWRVGVEPAARGTGVARALLLSSFAHMRTRGRTAALLHVDVANATGATALYESVGMRPVVVIDVWRCTRP